MRTMGIRAGDVVLVIEHRGEQQLVYNGLVVSFSMDEKLAGTHGEPAIEACFVEARDLVIATLRSHSVVHVSHRDFVERTRLGYEELPPELGRLINLSVSRAPEPWPRW